MPLFSIILPTFRRNKSGRLAKSINTVLAQSFSDFELLIVDDGSTDGSADTILSFQKKDSRVKHIRSEKNIGLPAMTCVSALIRSAGDFIAWMFDDCEWEWSYLSEMKALIDANPSVGIFYAQCAAHYSTDINIIGKQLDKNALLDGNNHIPNVATIVRRSLYYDLGWVDPRIILVRHNDWDFLQRAAKANISFAYLPKILTHEYGVSLADSLGNTYGSKAELVAGFANSDRRSELHPDAILSISAVKLPPDVNLPVDLLAEYLILMIEFSILGWRDELFKDISEYEEFSRLGVPLSNSTEQIRWWASAVNRSWRQEMQKKDFLIFEKQVYIDKQQVFIDKQNKFIQENIGVKPALTKIFRSVLRRDRF
jgi:glycosyltransferase involved in cell wall biosynthesis